MTIRFSLFSLSDYPRILPCAPSHHGMLRPLRLKRVRCIYNVVVNTPTSVRFASTHAHGHGHDRDPVPGASRSHEYHPVHAHSGTSTGPVPTHPPLDPAASTSASETCQNLVLKRDYESFLTSKFYPNDAKDGFFALKAFYVYTVSLLLLLRN